MKSKLSRSIRWAALTSLLLAVVYTVISLVLGTIPQADRVIKTELFSYNIPFTFSRWWDVGFIFLYTFFGFKLWAKMQTCCQPKSFHGNVDDQADISDFSMFAGLSIMIGILVSSLFLSETILAAGACVLAYWPVSFHLSRQRPAIFLQPEKCIPLGCVALGMTVGLVLMVKYGGVTALILGIITYVTAIVYTKIGLKLAYHFPGKEMKLISKEAS